MVFAMDEAGITPDKVDYINAHGQVLMRMTYLRQKQSRKALGEHAYEMWKISLQNL